MDGKDWYKVENLSETQKREIGNYEAGKKNSHNDFQSYRMLLNGENYSNIGSHNAVDDVAGNIAKYTKRILKKKFSDKQLSKIKVADLGGGCGFIAHELATQLKNRNIYSYDIAKDASAYGRRNFQDVNFVTKGIGEHDILEEGPFHAIFAYEFYPFTRTDEWGYQRNYVRMCLDNLRPGGILLIGLPFSRKRRNLLCNEKRLKEDFRGYHPHKLLMPYSKLVTMAAGHMGIAKAVSLLVSLVKERHYFLVVHK